MDPLAAEPGLSCCDLRDATTQRRLVLRRTGSIPGPARKPSQLARSTCADPVSINRPARQLASPGGLQSFLHDVRQDLLVQRQIRHEPLQPAVLVTQLVQLRNTHVGILLLPGIERRFADTKMPADVRHRRASLMLPQCLSDLLFRKL